ncbi:hypothetical protein PMAYCL1PPCAC_32957, partial [Pristionchus mayeri]
QSRQCLICTAPTTQCRLGIDCCRACAVFYRRVCASKSTPTECAKGDGKCVEKGQTLLCRTCRYTLLLEVLKNAESTVNENILISKRNLNAEFIRLDEVRKRQFVDHTTFSFDQPSCSFTPVLERTRQSYSLMCQTQKSAEMGTKPVAGQPSQYAFAGSKIDFVLSTPSMSGANRRIFESALYYFAEKAFPDFAQLGTANKERCISASIELVHCLESAYRASHYFPEDLDTHFDGYTTIWTGEPIAMQLADCEEFGDRESLAPNLEFKRTIREEYSRINPDNVEFIALIALAFWDNEVTESEELTAAARRSRSEILKELRKVYSTRGNIGSSSRQDELLSLLHRAKNIDIKCVSEKSCASTFRSEGILRRIERAYNASIERRRSKEKQMIESENEKQIVAHATEMLYLANETTMMQAFHISFAETRTFFREAFPSLATLNEQDQVGELFKTYFHKFSFIDLHYRTQQILGEVQQYAMASVLTVVNVRGTDHLNEDEGGEHRELLKGSIRAYVTNHLAIITPTFKKARITSKELHALLALALCEIEFSSDHHAHAISLQDELRSEVLLDLQRYYKEEMGLDDFSMRLGNLMTLNHCIRECNCLLNEYFGIHTTVFDQCKRDDNIKNIFLALRMSRVLGCSCGLELCTRCSQAHHLPVDCDVFRQYTSYLHASGLVLSSSLHSIIDNVTLTIDNLAECPKCTIPAQRVLQIVESQVRDASFRCTRGCRVYSPTYTSVIAIFDAPGNKTMRVAPTSCGRARTKPVLICHLSFTPCRKGQAITDLESSTLLLTSFNT